MRNLHERALALARDIQSAEAELVGIFQRINFRELGYSSLFAYATRGLGLSEALAYQIITVSRKNVPEFQQAIARGELTVSKAKSIVAAVTRESVAGWLEKARSHSTRDLEKMVARHTNKPLAKKFDFSPETLVLLERVQEVAAQKVQGHISLDEAIKVAALEYLKRNDPLEKKTLHGKSGVLKRNSGRCQYLLPDGGVCGEKKWLQLHHVIHRSRGGTDDPENLTTLCAAHHRMVHR